MASSLTEFSRALTAHGLDPGGQVAIIIVICLWIVLVAFKPKGRGASWVSVMPVLGPAERQALAEIAFMVAVVCVSILGALAISYVLQAARRCWRAERQLSKAWKREKDREESSTEDGQGR